MALELNSVASWLYAKLTGNAVIRNGVGVHPANRVTQVYEMIAPEGAVFPYVVFQMIGGVNRRGTGGRRVLVKLRYRVKVVSDGLDFGGLATISDAIDATLNQNQLLDAPTVIGCSALQPYQRQEIAPNGETYIALGAEYEILAYTQGDVI